MSAFQDQDELYYSIPCSIDLANFDVLEEQDMSSLFSAQA